jgi:putative membrane protein
MHDWTDGWWGHAGMMWIWILMGIVLVVLVVMLARGAFAGRFSPPPRREEPEDDPETILRRRYARGEIDEEELRRRTDELHAS